MAVSDNDNHPALHLMGDGSIAQKVEEDATLTGSNSVSGGAAVAGLQMHPLTLVFESAGASLARVSLPSCSQHTRPASCVRVFCHNITARAHTMQLRKVNTCVTSQIDAGQCSSSYSALTYAASASATLPSWRAPWLMSVRGTCNWAVPASMRRLQLAAPTNGMTLSQNTPYLPACLTNALSGVVQNSVRCTRALPDAALWLSVTKEMGHQLGNMAMLYVLIGVLNKRARTAGNNAARQVLV
jgi:hypothetical protein